MVRLRDKRLLNSELGPKKRNKLRLSFSQVQKIQFFVKIIPQNRSQNFKINLFSIIIHNIHNNFKISFKNL